MSFLKTNRKFVTISAAIWLVYMLAFICVYFVVIFPQHQSKKMLENELNKKKQMLESAQNSAKEENKNRAIEEINILRDKLGVFTTDFRNSASLTFHVSQIARENSVNSLNIESKGNTVATESTESDNIIENHFAVSFMAGFNQFATFLNELERNQPILFVNDFLIIRSNLNDSLCNVTMDVTAFIRKQQENEQRNSYSEIVSNDKSKSEG